MRSAATHSPAHTCSDSLFNPARATLATTNHQGRALPLRQVSRLEDHRALAHRAQRLAQRRYGQGGLNLFASLPEHLLFLRRHERALADFIFLPDSPFAGPCETDRTRGIPPAQRSPLCMGITLRIV